MIVLWHENIGLRRLINKYKEREPRKCRYFEGWSDCFNRRSATEAQGAREVTKERKNKNRKRGYQRASTDIDMTAKDIKDCADDEQMRDW